MKLGLYVIFLCSCSTLISCIDSDERYYSFYEKNSITQASKTSETERMGFVRVSQNEEFVEIQLSQGDTLSEIVKFKLEGNKVLGDWGIPNNYRKRIFFPYYDLKKEDVEYQYGEVLLKSYSDFTEERNGDSLKAKIYYSMDKLSSSFFTTVVSQKHSTQKSLSTWFTAVSTRQTKTNYSIDLLRGFRKMKAKSLFAKLEK